MSDEGMGWRWGFRNEATQDNGKPRPQVSDCHDDIAIIVLSAAEGRALARGEVPAVAGALERLLAEDAITRAAVAAMQEDVGAEITLEVPAQAYVTPAPRTCWL